MWTRSANARFIMKITVLVFFLSCGQKQTWEKCIVQHGIWAMCVCVCVPNVSAKDPQSHGVEEQPRDEEQKVEVCVQLVYELFPFSHIVATWWVLLGRGPWLGCIERHSHCHIKILFLKSVLMSSLIFQLYTLYGQEKKKKIHFEY